MPSVTLSCENWPIPKAVLKLSGRFEANGFKAYLVGGAVRDLLLGGVPDDYDLAVSANPDEIQALFPEYHQILDGVRHGTVGLVVNGAVYEVTSFRADGDYKDHRRPETVRFSRLLADDVFRRDFTINALAFHPKEGILDLCGGLRDLEQGLIRCVGDPARRFGEDALRILRAWRFAACRGFAIEAKTRAAALKAAGDLSYVAAERINKELSRLVTGAFFGSGWPLQKELLQRLLPLDRRLSDERLPALLDALPEDYAIRLAFLLDDRAGAAARALRLSRRDLRLVSALNPALEARPDTRPLPLLRFARDLSVPPETWALVASLKSEARGDNESVYWDIVFAQLADIKARALPADPRGLAIGGRELAGLGFAGGPRMGRLLEALWEGVVTGKVKNEGKALEAYALTLKSMF